MLTKFFAQMQNKMQEEKGQALVEYGLLVALIAVVCVAVITILGGQIQAAFQAIVDAL